METADHKPRAKGIPYESDYWLGGITHPPAAGALSQGERLSFAVKAHEGGEGKKRCSLRTKDLFPRTDSPLPSRERAGAEGDRVRGLFAELSVTSALPSARKGFEPDRTKPRCAVGGDPLG
jgi:hypothetical protein